MDELEVKQSEFLREKILGFEELMKQLPNIQYGDMPECPLTHTFSDGIYTREIFIPAGTLVVGKIHKHAHPNFLVEGEVTVVTEQKGIEHLKAPLFMISEAGTKRVVYAKTDTKWITVHKTDSTDLKEIEEQVIAKNFDELPEECNKILRLEGD